LFLFAQYRELMNWGQVRRKGSLVMGFQSILNFGSLGCRRIICMLKLRVFMWNTLRAFWNCYQDLPHNKVMFYWKLFGLLAIEELIINMHPFVLLLILSSLEDFIIPPYYGLLKSHTFFWALLHTCLFMTCLLVILFLCGL